MADQPTKGPYLGNIAKTYKRKELAEAIILPSKTIAQGFQTNIFLMDNGKTVTGYVTREAADKVTIRDDKGIVSPLNPFGLASPFHRSSMLKMADSVAQERPICRAMRAPCSQRAWVNPRAHPA